MNSIPPKIIDFIMKNHVVSLACYANKKIWSASCFYVFDKENARLIILTHRETEHSKMMLINPNIAGTISAQPEKLNDIEGIQFRATVRCLVDDSEKLLAQKLYFARHSVAKFIPSDLWEIRFDIIKHTENRTVFAHKTIWKA